jgi:hypothetical protein
MCKEKHTDRRICVQGYEGQQRRLVQKIGRVKVCEGFFVFQVNFGKVHLNRFRLAAITFNTKKTTDEWIHTGDTMTIDSVTPSIGKKKNLVEK